MLPDIRGCVMLFDSGAHDLKVATYIFDGAVLSCEYAVLFCKYAVLLCDCAVLFRDCVVLPQNNVVPLLDTAAELILC